MNPQTCRIKVVMYKYLFLSYFHANNQVVIVCVSMNQLPKQSLNTFIETHTLTELSIPVILNIFLLPKPYQAAWLCSVISLPLVTMLSVASIFCFHFLILEKSYHHHSKKNIMKNRMFLFLKH